MKMAKVYQITGYKANGKKAFRRVANDFKRVEKDVMEKADRYNCVKVVVITKERNNLELFFTATEEKVITIHRKDDKIKFEKVRDFNEWVKAYFKGENIIGFQDIYHMVNSGGKYIGDVFFGNNKWYAIDANGDLVGEMIATRKQAAEILKENEEMRAQNHCDTCGQLIPKLHGCCHDCERVG